MRTSARLQVQYCLLATKKAQKCMTVMKAPSLLLCSEKQIEILKRSRTLIQYPKNRKELGKMTMMAFLDLLFLLGLKSRMIPQRGPALPPGFRKPTQYTEDNSCSIGSSISSEFHTQATDSSEEDAVIGPMPAKGPVESNVTRDFERRAQRMKEKLTSSDDDGSKQVSRESWMTELPPELKGFGLGPRTFKRRTDEKSGDKSIWTDTPADRERKAQEMQEAKKSTSKADEEIVLSARDKRLAEQLSSYNDSKRSESLMDMHHKKLKSKAAEDKKPQERRPFDRDQDLQVNRFDEVQKKALIKKSRELNTRFSHSKGNMFL
ncbi:GPALPP motifs-containing protein 1 isoform X5 [Lepidochelys kempii]|uniref:GPALPP motifs-containing protein 1 isoform X3 n=1 Tax=Caretta caretta TaxID=8467 RepID=UPI0020962101|nr:GPALPP motifs-containing protein 1 isoform X4 [Caretta caretta]